MIDDFYLGCRVRVKTGDEVDSDYDFQGMAGTVIQLLQYGSHHRVKFDQAVQGSWKWYVPINDLEFEDTDPTWEV